MIQKILLSVLRFVVNYVKYFFLTGSVIFSLTILLFVILNIYPDFSFGFLKYFSFINPIYKEETFSMGIKEVMQVFSIISLVVYALAGLIKFIIYKIFNFQLEMSFKNKAFLLFSLITIFFILSVILIKFNNIDKGLYVIFIVFYIINIISTFLYLATSKLSYWINNLMVNFAK